MSRCEELVTTRHVIPTLVWVIGMTFGSWFVSSCAAASTGSDLTVPNATIITDKAMPQPSLQDTTPPHTLYRLVGQSWNVLSHSSMRPSLGIVFAPILQKEFATLAADADIGSAVTFARQQKVDAFVVVLQPSLTVDTMQVVFFHDDTPVALATRKAPAGVNDPSIASLSIQQLPQKPARTGDIISLEEGHMYADNHVPLRTFTVVKVGR